MNKSELVLVLAPYGRDGELIQKVLGSEGIQGSACRDVDALIKAFREGAAAAIIADEALRQSNIPVLAAALAEQPSWSDLPVLLLTGNGEDTISSRKRLRILAPLGNFTLVERPIRTTTFLSAVQTALRARRRQYQIQEHLEQQQALMTSLRENEANLTFALDAGQLGSWELKLPEMDVTISVQCRRNFGLPEEGAFVWDDWLALVHEEDREHMQRHLNVSRTGRASFQAEYRVIRGDGATGWLLAAGRPVHDEAGVPARIIGVTLDITERKKGEEAIRESESRLRALADSMPQLAWMADRDGSIFWYNSRWYEYTGTTLEQMQGWGWQLVHDAEMLPQVLLRWKESIATGKPFEMEFPLRSAAGEMRWFLTLSRPVFDDNGEVFRWFGTNTDINDKRQTEKALLESEELARSVIQSSPDCVEVLDRSGKTVLVNKASCELLGLPETESPDTLWLDTWQGLNRELARAALEKALAGKDGFFEATGRIGGENKTWEVVITPIKNAEGAIFRILCVSHDITARLRAEEELRQTAKLESLGVMAGGIAHDFNNLLTGIMGNASMLVDSVAAKDRAMAEDIVLAAERASDLTRQMLAYSGKGRFENKPIDLSALSVDILRLVRPGLDKNVQVEIEAWEEACVMEGDPGQIQQVIMNLVINAAEALEGRPGRVKILTGRARVSPEHPFDGRPPLPSGEYVCLEVRDNGKGMDAATLARIFDPFFTTKFTGRGLGLAAVSGIVRGHKGSLQVESQPGAGSTFRALFPASSEIPQPPQWPQEPHLRAGEGLILLVDDETIVQRTGAAALTRSGFRVLLASNGREAVELFRKNHERLDAVVLDMTMPVMNGEDAIDRIREIDSKVPVIVCSGYNEVEVARRFASRKVGAFLQKPYTGNNLVAKVQSILKGPSS